MRRRLPPRRGRARPGPRARPVAGAQAAPNDPYFGLQWGQQQIHSRAAWATSTGAGQTIAIVDSGVELSHPDLAGKIAGGATFTGCATQPNGCGNGDWQSAPSAGPPSPHGTHVAGIAAAVTEQRHRRRRHRARRAPARRQGR